jgi:hypothetical protein
MEESLNLEHLVGKTSHPQQDEPKLNYLFGVEELDLG